MMRDTPHLLIVDDDDRLRDLLKTFLVRSGFLVSTARDAAHARRLLAGLQFDLIVLDVMMPGEDGITFCADLRNRASTPVLLLTARSETADRIAGLEAGADDYLAKPFEPKELLLRINAILRRVPVEEPAPKKPTKVRFGDHLFDSEKGQLWLGDSPVRLTATEQQLMKIFADHIGEPVSRARLVEEVNRSGGQTQERAIDVQITRMRRKVETDPKHPRHIQTVRGEGYRLTPD